MLKFHSVLTTGAAALMLFPALQASDGDLTVLRGALEEIQRALQVLNSVEPRIAGGEPGSSALVRSLTEAPLADPQVADRELERLRNEVNLLQVELDVGESGPLPPGPPTPDPWVTSAGDAEAPPVSTGLSAEQRLLLGQESAGPVLPPAPAAAPARPGTALRVPGKLGAEKTAPPAADAGYSADPLRHAEACLRAGRYKEGFAVIAARTDPSAVYLQARLLEKLGRLDEAIEALSSVAGKLPEGSEGRRAQSDLEFFKWKRDFLKRLPAEPAAKADDRVSHAALDATPELKEAMQAFAGISESLVRSYQALDERARLVEEELGRTNAELARKVSELALVNGHLEAVLRSLPTGVVVRDAAHRIVRANAAAIALLEAGPLPVSGDREEIVEVTGRDGVRRTVATRRSALRDPRGAAAGSVEILDDRTELATMTERVHALDKMAALGTLGGGIAHEIRNPLNAVKGFAELLERSLAGGDPQPARWARCIVEGAAEADAIIESLLAFASPERLKQDALDGAELLRDAARAALGDEPRHALSLRSDAPPFLGDRIKLRQALRNLIANAAQAQAGGGSIEVELERSGGELLFRVRDAGPGIPRALRAKVQDPFFTTRPEGTGLGLALVSTIARLHAGRVDIGSAPPRLGGAEITLRIPFHPVQPHGPSEEKRTF